MKASSSRESLDFHFRSASNDDEQGAKVHSDTTRQTEGLVDKVQAECSVESQGPTASPWARVPAWKRGLDLSCIMIALPLWLPIMTFVALIIKAVSRGPIFFRQQRIGVGGASFMMLKFRSMEVNTETQIHESHLDRLIQSNCPMTKLDTAGDSRVIPGGRWLRAMAVDELPQLFNVIRGEMSLVGPRPCTLHEFRRYSAEQREERVKMLPGLTGYWQVNGKNKTTFSQMIGMDRLYGEKMSIWLDLVIMARTIPVILAQVVESRSKKSGERKIAVRDEESAADLLTE